MKIKSLSIDGFRSLLNFKVSFEENLTVIVGENDSGKTSLIDCLKIITQNKSVELDDFNPDKDKISLKIEVNELAYEKVYETRNNEIIANSLVARPTSINYLKRIRHDCNSMDLEKEDKKDKIKDYARIFGIPVRSNSNLETLKNNILSIIDNNINNPEFKIEAAKFPEFNNIQLDGRRFENVSAFFKEVFLKEKQKSIWNEKINEETTIEQFIVNTVDRFSEEISREMNCKGIKDKIAIFINDLTDIKIEPIYQSKDLNIDAKVKFLENGNEINLDKKGDGTKRRITMALLEFKKEEILLPHDNSTIYLLDEPDTHLHVKAQIELLETLKSFAENDNQVIITTHSPFLINAINPNQIRLLHCQEQNLTKVKSLKGELQDIGSILQRIGVENIYLFFARTIILVEGETEESFLSTYYYKVQKRTLQSNLVKIINVKGINNIPGFSQAILELHNPEKIFVVHDNDASSDLQDLIGGLKLNNEQKHVIGTREFEDAFASEVLYRCWQKYHEYAGRECPEGWTCEAIESIKNSCNTDPSKKFSKKLSKLNEGGKKMTKPIFGQALAKYIEEHELPRVLNELLDKI